MTSTLVRMSTFPTKGSYGLSVRLFDPVEVE
jgi:hypothetical protein